MKKFVLAVAFAVASLPLFGLVAPALADSPGQLSNSPDNYKVRNVTQNGAYGRSTSATCDETVKYSIILANSDFGLLRELTVKANLVSGAINASAKNADNETTAVAGNVTVNLNKGSLVYIPGTTVRITSDGQTRTPLADGITAGGVNAGQLNGSTQIFVQFEAKVDCPEPPKPPTQSLLCSALNLTILNNEKRQVKATVTGQTLNGATITGYSINFDDGTTVNQQTAEHTYGKDGGYIVTGFVTGQANGKPQTVSAKDCMKSVAFNAPEPPLPPEPPVTPPTTPPVIGTSIPNTGAEGLAAITAGVSGLGAAAHQLYIRRRK